MKNPEQRKVSSTLQVYALISLQGYEGESSALGIVSWLKLGEVSHQVDYTDSDFTYLSHGLDKILPTLAL